MSEDRLHVDLDLSDVTELIDERPGVLIVGFGRAGERFYRALRFLWDQHDAIDIVGVCDVNAEQFQQIDDPRIVRTTNLRWALAKLQPQIVCVCVNEVSHIAALEAVAECESVRAVFSEKPLTETLEQCERAIPMLGSRLVAVNFVERYSPVVDMFRQWQESVAAEVMRVKFLWAKYRFMDPRPTMGVLSEISHPIDLTRYLIGASADAEVVIHQASGTRSRFSVVDRPLLDTVDVNYSVDGVDVRGSSSFLWDDRSRRIILYGRQQASRELFQAVFDFDNPQWDCDTLRVWRMDESSRARYPVLHRQCTNDDLPAGLSHVFKVGRYCATALRAMYEPEHVSQLVTGKDALSVQRVIEGIRDRIGECRDLTL